MQVPADLYFVKTCIIASEMARKQDADAPGTHTFCPDAKIIVPPNGKGKYDAAEFKFGGRAEPEFYYYMHYIPKIMPFAKFAVEYLREKSRGV